MKKIVAMMLLAVGLWLSEAPVWGDAAKKKASKGDSASDVKKIEGVWQGVSGEKNGEKVPEDEIMKLKFSVEGEKWTIKVDDDEKVQGTLKLDATKKPKELDATLDSGEAIKGIYELHGDSLKICWSDPGNDRPKEFSTKADAGQHLAVYKRAKK